jgi:pSer/pThr/pTyr-binding forkhead associated (FHA) protein
LKAGDTALVGRSSECDVVLDDPIASRRHLRIIALPDRVEIEDLRSRNGVFVNCVRVGQRARLNEGDEIGLAPENSTRDNVSPAA